MPFDIGAGLSEAGKSVAQTAQAYTLEAQKADLEKEKVLLADQLAGAREEKGRTFTTSERVATQTFQGGENEKTRTNQVDIANIGAKAHVQAAGIGAGATIAAAHENATAHLLGIQKQLDAMAPERTASVEGKQIENATKSQLLGARDDYLKALEGGDIDAQTKAIQKMAGIEFSPKDQYTEASLYQTQARLYEQAMTSALTKLATLQASATTSMTPEGKVAIESLSKQVQLLQGNFQAAIGSAKDVLGRVPNYGGRGGTATNPGEIEYDASGNRVTGGGAVTGEPQSIINTPANRR